MGRDEDALGLLLGGFTGYLSNRPSPHGSGPFSTIVFKENLPRKLQSDAFNQLLELIQILHKKMDQDGSLTGAIRALARIQFIRKHFPPHGADQLVVIEAMSLAFEYSQASMLYKADVVYEFAVPELLSLPDNFYPFRKGCEFKDYAQHCQRSHRWASSVAALKAAFDNYMGLSNFHVLYCEHTDLVEELDQLGIRFRRH